MSKCKFNDCGWCYAPQSLITSAAHGACVNPNACVNNTGGLQDMTQSIGLGLLKNMSTKELLHHLGNKPNLTEIEKVLLERLDRAEQTIEKGFASAVVQSELVQNAALDAKEFLERLNALRAKL